ncbi:unnamed protein product [marine sediment metagenome]|uniref:Uncharacterized protein n=1 Tax=marine sediment metagenome TaxID=412755 RepID=X1SUX9_9ZZZZ
MKSIGLVFLYDRNLGAPDEVSKKFSKFFSFVSENLVLEGLVELPKLKEIMDLGKIYWAGIKQNFETILEDHDAIGKIAWKVFNDYSGIEPSEYRSKNLLAMYNISCITFFSFTFFAEFAINSISFFF